MTLSPQDTKEKKRKRYSSAFKLDIVRRSHENESINELAQQLNIPPNNILNWRRKYRQGILTERERRFYDTACKLDAVLRSNGKENIHKVAQELNISVNTINSWKTQYRQGKFTEEPPKIFPDKEFKLNAVLRSYGKEEISTVAEELNVSKYRIKNWRKQYRLGKLTKEPPKFPDTAFKLDAVLRSNGKGNIDKIAQELNIYKNTLKNWRRDYRQGKFTGEVQLLRQDIEFKLNAVKQSDTRGSIAAVAELLNISKATLAFWRAEYKKGKYTEEPPLIKRSKNIAINSLRRKLRRAKRESAELKIEYEILKKHHCLQRQEIQERYEFIRQHKGIFPIMKMFKVLKVCSAAYYDWLIRPPSKRVLRNQMLLEEIRKIYSIHKGRYGCTRITKELQMNGHRVSQYLVSRLMKEAQLSGITKEKSKITTIASSRFPVVENKLSRNFNVTRQNEVWVSDITYIRVNNEWLYLTTVIDLFDRKIIGWIVSNIMRALNTTVAAFKKAVKNRPIKENCPLIFHSDRGAQYTAKSFTSEIKKYVSVTRSMSGKRSSSDNAVAESFFSRLKMELVYQTTYKTKEQAQESITDYIENYYNINRRHSALNNLTITEFHKLNGNDLNNPAL